jgi:uncharacterized RDD family membrane protein YckC
MTAANERSAGSGWILAMILGAIAIARAMFMAQKGDAPLLITAVQDLLGGSPPVYGLALIGIGVISIASSVAKWSNAHPYEISRRPAYAGFWRRMVAALVDWLVMFPLTFALAVTAFVLGVDMKANEQALGFISYGLWGLYLAVMESSSAQATFGKMLVGARVANLDGGRIGFGRALLRQLGKIVSVVGLFAGVIMIAVHPKNRGLHDKMTGCLVINTRSRVTTTSDDIAEHARSILRCAALCNVLAMCPPEFESVDQEVLDMRDFFADIYAIHLSAIRGRRVAAIEVADLLDDELEELQRQHEAGELERSLSGMLASCGAWVRQLEPLRGTVNPSELDEADFAVVRNLLLKVDPPSDQLTQKFERQLPRDVRQSARNSLRIWTQRGYPTPRKARRELGVG